MASVQFVLAVTTATGAAALASVISVTAMASSGARHARAVRELVSVKCARPKRCAFGVLALGIASGAAAVEGSRISKKI